MLVISSHFLNEVKIKSGKVMEVAKGHTFIEMAASGFEPMFAGLQRFAVNQYTESLISQSWHWSS